MSALDPVGLTRDLVRCETVTPAAKPALDLLEKHLGDLGFCCVRPVFEEPGTYPVENLFAKLGSGSPHLAFAGHVDVVPVGDPARWSVAPFGGELKDGRLYGRGSADMKSGVACFVAAVSKFLEKGPPAGAISFLIAGDEESEAVNGTVKLLAWAQERGETFDACLVGEPTCPEHLGDMAKIGRRGSLVGRLKVRGKLGHTAYPQRADNAAHRLVAALQALATTPIDGGTEWFEPSNLQVTSIDIGNPAANVVPGEASAVFNIRFNDGQSVAKLEAWLRGLIEPLAPDYDLNVQSNADAFVTAPGPLTDMLADAVEAVTGLRPKMSTTGGTSDARFIKNYCPVVEFGLVGTTMHQADEHVAVADIQGLTRIYEAFLDRWFGRA
ncbi:MAG: succinyl-diaminopimelate desuccinylase [Geminicoccaceae bacterium]